ncbi:VTT domain-containing protein [Enterobacteriaceae bacterium 155047]|uniref:DedA family protein n=1 Tax=Huaxiibacter chinensis TaxID=2899785 RepID=UPI0007DA644A|nr:VTT domain-containing protein [Huaxiibacter chinensis]ANG92344.1 DedA family protein [Lelliottia amnigena]MCG5042839.1 VTT domain-containing protein [Huaxiibacter chinensis]
MAGWESVLHHFSLYPVHLFALLFAVAWCKSTIVVSSVLPPASVMLLAGISVSVSVLHPLLTWSAVMLGAATGSVLNYHVGQLMGQTRYVTRLTERHAAIFLRVQNSLHKNSVMAIFSSRFLAVLRYLVPLAAGILRLHAGKVYFISLLSASLWAGIFVGAVTGFHAW